MAVPDQEMKRPHRSFRNFDSLLVRGCVCMYRKEVYTYEILSRLIGFAFHSCRRPAYPDPPVHWVEILLIKDLPH